LLRRLSAGPDDASAVGRPVRGHGVAVPVLGSRAVGIAVMARVVRMRH
jgi:hypothetical protein